MLPAICCIRRTCGFYYNIHVGPRSPRRAVGANKKFPEISSTCLSFSVSASFTTRLEDAPCGLSLAIKYHQYLKISPISQNITNILKYLRHCKISNRHGLTSMERGNSSLCRLTAGQLHEGTTLTHLLFFPLPLHCKEELCTFAGPVRSTEDGALFNQSIWTWWPRFDHGFNGDC